MTMTSQRTTRRFIAVIGFVETLTNEAYPRILRQPQPGHAIRPDGLMPILHIVGERRKHVGTMYDVVILGTQLIALGYLGVESAEDEIRVEALERGQLFMELDIDSEDIREEQYGLVMHGWRVRAVHLGTAPTWTLPSVHVWEA